MHLVAPVGRLCGCIIPKPLLFALCWQLHAPCISVVPTLGNIAGVWACAHLNECKGLVEEKCSHSSTLSIKHLQHSRGHSCIMRWRCSVTLCLAAAVVLAPMVPVLSNLSTGPSAAAGAAVAPGTGPVQLADVLPVLSEEDLRLLDTTELLNASLSVTSGGTTTWAIVTIVPIASDATVAATVCAGVGMAGAPDCTRAVAAQVARRRRPRMMYRM
jgi:hypothetical protein